MAKMSKNPMNKKDSKLFAETRSVEKIMVRTSCPCAVPKPVRNTMPRQPPSGVPAEVCPWPDNNMRIRRKSPTEVLTRGASLQHFRPAKQDLVLVRTIDIDLVRGVQQLDRLLEKWRRFTRQHGFVDDACAMDQEDVSRDDGFGL